MSMWNWPRLQCLSQWGELHMQGGLEAQLVSRMLSLPATERKWGGSRLMELCQNLGSVSIQMPWRPPNKQTGNLRLCHLLETTHISCGLCPDIQSVIPPFANIFPEVWRVRGNHPEGRTEDGGCPPGLGCVARHLLA